MLAATVRLLPRSTQCIRHFHQSLQRPVLHPINSTLLQRRCLGLERPGTGKKEQDSFKRKVKKFVGFVFSATVSSLIIYVAYAYKAEQERLALEEVNKRKPVQSKGVAAIGGPFELSDLKGTEVTESYLLGKWSMIYFGFTHCPDVCPEELEKLGEIVDLVALYSKQTIHPIFISVDPKRDTPDMITTYLEDFHPKFLGLTGNAQQIRKVTRAYRVYYSEGPAVAGDENDYMVDHTIVMYLIDPNGKFCKHFSQRSTAEGAAKVIVDAIVEFKENAAELAL